MADISLKLAAAKLGKSLDLLGSQLESELNAAVKNLAASAYASMMANIQQSKSSSKTKQEYARGLKFENLGENTYMIHLEGDWANKIEEGFGSYSIRELLLNSTKTVQVGSRSGEKWVRIGKQGQKYASVPFEHGLSTVGAKGGDLGTDIKQMFAKNLQGKNQPLRQIFKDLEGNPLAGKVATITDAINDKFQGLTKYQYVHPSGKVTSLFTTYRTVSENGKDWQHPGYGGRKLFSEAEKFIRDELENIVKEILK